MTTVHGTLLGVALGASVSFLVVWAAIGATGALIAVAIGATAGIVATPLVLRWRSGRR